jgi:hypothetical protein
VKEWVDDILRLGTKDWEYGVVRDSDWRGFNRQHLEMRHREYIAPVSRVETVGFRVVLAKEDEQELKEPIAEIQEDGGDTN